MVLFARCSNCQTVFQVTAAQLDAARGFVRCGRCQTAFNARDSLQDEQGRPVSLPTQEEDTSAANFIHIASDQPSFDESSRTARRASDRTQPTVVKVIGDVNYLDSVAAFSATPKTADSTTPPATKPKAKPVTKPSTPPVKQTTAPSVTLHKTDTPDTPDEAIPESDAIEIPTLFLAATMDDLAQLRYPMQQKTNRPLVRIDLLLGWLAACMLLIVLLFAQLAFFSRERAVNYQPLRLGLEAACSIFDCALPPRRALSEFAIIDRNVAVHPTRPDTIIAEMIFANHATFDQPLPLIEFSLLDPSSEPFAWRQFTPEEYLSETPSESAWIKPNEPLLMKVLIANPGGEIENYRFRFF